MTERDEHAVMRAALTYVEMGFAVLPIYGVGRDLYGVKSEGFLCWCMQNCHSPGKHPMWGNGVKDASTDEDWVGRYFRRHPEANIAVACGKRSGIGVVDIDPR